MDGPSIAVAVAAETFAMAADEITDDLAFQSVPAWDSLGHVRLMMALQERLGCPIDQEAMAELGSIAALKAFAARAVGGSAPAPVLERRDAVQRGLAGVTMDTTAISEIDAQGSMLSYRGYAVADLARHAGFEATAHLLIRGELPDAAAAAAFAALRDAGAAAAAPARDVLGRQDGPPLHALAAAFATLPPAREDPAEDGIMALGQMAALAAAQAGAAPAAPGASCAARLLGAGAAADDIATLDRVLVMLADHGANASSLAARVATGAQAHLRSALLAALATFSGGVHGGAADRVTAMLDALPDPAAAAAEARALLAAGRPVSGFGHRVYRQEDPRATLLRAEARALAARRGGHPDVAKLAAFEEAVAPYGNFGLAANVDLYLGTVLRLLGVRSGLAGPVFAVARTAGWVAQVLEQRAANVLIRPNLLYVGPPRRPLPPGA